MIYIIFVLFMNFLTKKLISYTFRR